jgi:hypothetical protein
VVGEVAGADTPAAAAVVGDSAASTSTSHNSKEVIGIPLDYLIVSYFGLIGYF